MLLLTLHPAIVAMLAMALGWAAVEGLGMNWSPVLWLAVMLASAAAAVIARSLRHALQAALWNAGHRLR